LSLTVPNFPGEAYLGKIAPTVLFLISVLITPVSMTAQDDQVQVGRDLRAGWIDAPSSSKNPDLWSCAGRGGSWVVAKHEDVVVIKEDVDTGKQVLLPPQLKLSKEMVGRRSLLRTSDGFLVGFDAGEFGGGLWWFRRDGSDSMKLLSDNVHAIYETTDGIFVLLGLAHGGSDTGQIVQFLDGSEEVSFKSVANLGGSPEASVVGSDGSIVIATMRSVVRVDRAGRVHELYKSGEELTYPKSVVIDGNGSIFVAMRFFVLRLIPQKDAYQPQWLMPKKCRTFKMVKYICSCTASD
jgi:hypothetical protein